MYKKNWLKTISLVLVVTLLIQSFPLAVRADDNLPAELECDPQSGMSALYEYETFDAGMAGMAYINAYLGTLHLRRSDLTLGGERMPVAIEFYYDAETNNTTSPYGLGWNCVYNQKLIYDQSTGKYAFKNENGTWLYFANSGTLTDSGSEIWVEDVDYGVGLVGMELYLPATSAETNYPQVDLAFSDVHYSFDTSGRLVRLSNGSNQIVISYATATDDRIQTITDSVGRKFHFTYVNGYLTSVDATTYENVAIASATVSYSVVGGKLTSVTYATDNVVSYAYDTSNRLSSVVNTDLCGYNFSYSGNTDIVTTVTNKAAMGTENEASGYETIFDRSVEEKVTITRDTVQYQYSFDGCGRLVGCEIRMKSEAAAVGEGASFFQCVYGYNLTYGYVTDDNGTITNTVVDMEAYDADGVIQTPEEDEEESTPEETEPSEDDDPYTYTHDAFGNVLTETYRDGSWHQTSTYTYSEDGNYLLSHTDENGNTVQYQYDLNTGLLSALTDANQNTTEYTYNAMRELQTVQLDVSDLANGTGMQARYNYSSGRLAEIVYGSFTYAFTYDAWGNVTKVTMNNKTLVSYDYGTSAYKGQAATVTYGNNQKVFYSYNGLGQVVTVGYTGQLNRFQYTYAADGSLTQIHDSVLNETTVYTENGFEIRNSTNAVIYSYTSDENGSFSENIRGTVLHSTYDASENAKTITNASGSNILLSVADYGSFGYRIGKRNNVAGVGVSQEYAYPVDSSNAVQSLVGEYTLRYERNGLHYIQTFDYSYDGNGNIIAVVETVQREDASSSATPEETTYVTVAQYTQNYTYDEAGQLTYARDTKTGETRRYTYDSSGNITTALTYKHTSSGTETLYSTKNYGYVNGVLKTVSESILGNTATVTTYQADNMGNPTKITKGSTSATLSWGRGRMLTGITWSSSNYVNYEYNADGLRVKKNVVKNGTATVTEYIWGENGLAGMVTGNNTVIVLYDVEGEPAGFTVNGIAYTYIKNIQGDVMQILDSNGSAVVTYSYDPWGVPTVTGNTTLAALNPCSYRGYDYDEETGYYYLQSRYYDPAVGRFLNADDSRMIGINGHPISLNTFVYCENNPVNMVDQYGYFALPWEIKVGLAAGVASAIWEAVSFIYSNPGLNILSWTFMKGLGGAITLGFARGFLLGVITCISRSWQFGAIGGTISLLYEITVNSSQGKSTSINQGVSAFMNGWSAAVYSRTVSNVLGNVSRVLRWSTRKTDIIEFIFDTLVGLGITNYLKW